MTNPKISIEKMTFGGAGLGHIEGKVCFVPYTAPGDCGTIRVMSEKRSFIQGELLDLLNPSSVRVPPPCPVFGSCGGCDWQHIDYRSQLEAKQQIFAELLWRTGRVDPHVILPIVPSPTPYGYRSRIQLKVRHVSGMMHIGFYRAGSHFVVDIPRRCAIATPPVNNLMDILTQILLQIPEPDKFPQVDVTTGDRSEVAVIFHYIGERREEVTAFLAKPWGFPVETGVYLQTGRKESMTRIGGPERLTYTVPSAVSEGAPDMTLGFSPGAFSQVNHDQNMTLIRTVGSWAGLTGVETVLDLYCGNGNLSLPLAKFTRSLLGIEEIAASIGDAEFNCAANHVRNAAFSCSDARTAVERLVEDGKEFDVVILDPPRTGAADLVRLIPCLKPARVIYVSCDPATLGRDAGMLRKLDYVVTKTMAVDMFPQTYHIESVTLFEPAQAAPSSGGS